MFRRLAALATTAVAVVATAAAPAHADDEIGLSTDGVTWAEQLSAPLFAPGFRIVPGDAESRTFRVRNDGPSAGLLTVDVDSADPDGLLGSGDLTIEARVGAGAWQPVAAGTTRTATRLKVAEGAQTTVTVRATFDWDSTRQDQSVPFSVHLQLSEDGEVGGVDEGNGNGNGNGDGGGEVGGESEGLPATGSAVAPGLLWLAAGLVGAGLALVRRRDRDDEGADRG
ncbi:LPXTG cell wall anchor domain-containing protein [Pimelobacter simplex]|uniref:LPXTG cell wall anchor domain-containing protein n=1 Tax=Nocardioides simplex TaxID=2045 RepID=UPI003AAB221A